MCAKRNTDKKKKSAVTNSNDRTEDFIMRKSKQNFSIEVENMIQFDALPMYNKDNKYSNTMLVDEIPEAERNDLARQVADKILASLKDGTRYQSVQQTSSGCGSQPHTGS